MAARLSVVVTADPEIPVPPAHYGGIERIVHFLVEGLVHQGHDVVLVAHPDSRASCDVVAYPGRSQTALDFVRNAAAVTATVLKRHPDVVHSFGRLGYLAPLACHPVRKIMSYQRAVTPRSVRMATRIFGRSLEFTACSQHMIAPVQSIASWHVVYNGVPLDRYTFRSRVAPDAPLVFLGRLEAIKGPHLAIEAARRAGRALILAGNVEPAHQPFFDDRVRPFLDDRAVRYIGPVDDRAKNELLGQSAALLMPIQWDEPFGIVMAEALACGTPVVGLRRGSVPEVVADGVTGFVADDVAGLADRVGRLDAIDRQACRLAAEDRFSDRVIVQSYEQIYAAATAASTPIGRTSPSESL